MEGWEQSSPILLHPNALKSHSTTSGAIRGMAWEAVNSGRRERYLGEEFRKPNCKPTARHRTVLGITNQNHQRKNGEQERMVSYCAVRNGIRIIELENR